MNEELLELHAQTMKDTFRYGEKLKEVRERVKGMLEQIKEDPQMGKKLMQIETKNLGNYIGKAIVLNNLGEFYEELKSKKKYRKDDLIQVVLPTIMTAELLRAMDEESE